MPSYLHRFAKALRSDRHQKEKQDSQVPSTVPVRPTQAASSHTSIAEQLWSAGYQQLQQENPKLVNAFEDVLSKRFGRTGPITSQDLQVLVQELTKKVSITKLECLDYVLKAKDVVSSSLQASTEATLAWSAVCIIIEVLVNTARETAANQDGLQYIIQRLRFNNELVQSRLASDRDTTFNDLQIEVRERITTLYQKILHYLFQSVVYLQQNRAANLVKDSIKFYDWEKLLQQVKDAETAATADYSAYKGEKDTSNLQTLARIARTTQDSECLKQLRITDPRDDKKRIEEEKGGLLKDAYKWILDNKEFVSWKSQALKDGDSTQDGNQKSKNLLWIRGDPGKGKTMLLCGVIDELRKEDKQLAFFFCQATDTRINSAESVIRGLLYILADEDQTSKVLSCIREKSDHSDGSLFKDTNAWFVLKDIFTKVIRDLADKQVWLIVDALDECVDIRERERLLDLFKNSPANVKWLVSSRNWSDIEEHLDSDETDRLSLELNAESVTVAVNKYVNIKTEQLADKKILKPDIVDSIRTYLMENAHGTFLWVGLVCQNLFLKAKPWNIFDLLKRFPSGLDPMYERISSQIDETDEAELTKQILAIAATTFRPLSLAELGALLPEPIDDEHLIYAIKQSGFLASQSSSVSFVHLSAKDFIMKPSSFLINRTMSTHQLLYQQSIKVMSNTLCRNIYSVQKVGYRIDEFKKPSIDPLASVVYPCLYWPQHLLELWKTISDVQTNSSNQGMLRDFLQQSYLYWIEALIWLRSLSHGINAMIRLEEVFTISRDSEKNRLLSKDVEALCRDGLRFILSCIDIQEYPLQVYTSALYFSPTSSLIRELFEFEIPSWLKAKHQLPANWSQEFMSFNIDNAWKLVLSPDGQKLAIIGVEFVYIRNAITGVLELEIDTDFSDEASFTGDGLQIMILESKGSICKYECSSGKRVKRVIFNDVKDSKYLRMDSCLAYNLRKDLLMHSYGKRLNCRDASWHLLRAQQFESIIKNLKISPDGSKLLVATEDKIIRLCVTDSGHVLWMKESLFCVPSNFNITLSGDKVVGTVDESICYWNIETGIEESKIMTSSRPFNLLVCGDGLLYARKDGSVVRCSQSGEQSEVLRQENWRIKALAANQKWLILLTDNRLKFYNLDETVSSSEIPGDVMFSYGASNFVVSPDWKYSAMALNRETIRLWNDTLQSQDFSRPTGTFSPRKTHPFNSISSLSLSYDDRLAIVNDKGDVALLHIAATPKLLTSFTILGAELSNINLIFSPKGPLALFSGNLARVFIYDDNRMKALSNYGYGVKQAIFSSQGYLAVVYHSLEVGHKRHGIKIWNTDGQGSLIHSFDDFSWYNSMSFSYDGGLFAYILITDGYDRHDDVQILETKTWQVVETIKISRPREKLKLTYSQSMGCFREKSQMLYPNNHCTELFSNGKSISVGNELVLVLPVIYHSRDSEIRGNSIIHGFASGDISLLEIDTEEAIKDETKRKNVRRRAVDMV